MGTVDLAEVEPTSWSRFIAFVPQDNKLIYATVRDNIRFYRPEYSPEEVEAAARSAHLHDEIADLPMGYETLVGPGARDLSGGQRQRLGIARGVRDIPSCSCSMSPPVRWIRVQRCSCDAPSPN